MIAIIARPDRAHKEEPLAISRHICSRHPAIFQFKRQDWNVSNIINDGGYAVFRVSMALPYTSDIEEGETLYSSQYGTSGRVTLAYDAGGFYYWKTDMPYSAYTGGYLVHTSRPAYRIEVSVMLSNALTGTTSLAGTLQVTTNGAGIGQVDVSSLLSGNFDKKNLSKYDQRNWRDNYVHGAFYLIYQEKWRGVEALAITDEVTVIINEADIQMKRLYIPLDATKYLLDDYGQNLCEYKLHNYDSITTKAKFLTDFVTPTFFPGYPFDLSFIYPSEISTLAMTKHERRLDKSGTLLGSGNWSIDQSDAGGVHRLRLEEGYAANVAQLDVYLKGDSITQSSYYEDGYIADGYFETIPTTPIAMTPFEITERKRVKIFNGCADRPVYLAWRGTKANWNYWLFTLNQQINYSAKSEGEYQTEPDELSTANSRKKFAQMNQVKKMRLFTRVSIEDLIGLSSIEGSPCVQMLYRADLLATEPERAWLTVRMIPRGFTYQTKAVFADVELEIELPEFYTVPN